MRILITNHLYLFFAQLDDIEVQYQPPQDHQFQINFEELSATAVVKESKQGFQVRGGPWEKKSKQQQSNHGQGQQQQHNSFDSSNAQDFPAFGGGPGSGVNGNGGLGEGGDGGAVVLNGGSAWGPRKN